MAGEPGSGSTVAADMRRLGLLADDDDPVVTPLTGGVSSDIMLVQGRGRRFVVKRALPKLRVAADWRAPVERNVYEVAWMREAALAVPDSVPAILADDPRAGLFAMDYLDPDSHPVWKGELLAGRVSPDFAARVGRRLAAIHAATAGRADIAARFPTDAIFHAIRLEPYLEATARRHPEVAPMLMALSADTLARKVALVHGDVSPKNILCGPCGPVFLDAECAWHGDPAFDIAFCANHLLLKCVPRPQDTGLLLRAFDALVGAYLAGADWEDRLALEARAARLLPALLLARVDGKSPVEYLTAEDDRQRVRSVALPLVLRPPPGLAEVRAAWTKALP